MQFAQIADELGDSGADGFSFGVHIRGGSTTDQSIEQTMARIEKKRAQSEVALFDQAAQELDGLTDIVVHELQVW